jgi:hypothetical protein
MANDDHAVAVDDVARELDLLVFDLEQAGHAPADAAVLAERDRLRRRLERLRDRLQDIALRMTR